MRRMAWGVLALFCAGIVGFSALHHAGAWCHRGWGMSRFVQGRVDRALDDLKANDSQRHDVHAVADTLLSDFDTLQTGQEQARAEGLAQWNAAQPDTAKVHALVDARMEALRTFAHQMADGAVQIHGILTPDQRAQISERVTGRR